MARPHVARPRARSTSSRLDSPERPPSKAITLDRLIHERLRLGIVTALAGNAVLTFSDLKTLLQTTDGNLSVHARKLEDAGYVSVTKTVDQRLPRTEFRLTPAGRSALRRYLDLVDVISQEARTGLRALSLSAETGSS